MWYRRSFDVPSTWHKKRVILHIDACDYETDVYINGKFVGNHRGGYTPFSFDITDELQNGENYVTVNARDDLRNER